MRDAVAHHDVCAWGQRALGLLRHPHLHALTHHTARCANTLSPDTGGGGGDTIATGGSHVFDADTSQCPDGSTCTYTWMCSVTDAGGNEVGTFDKEGASITVTAGAGASFDVDMNLVASSRAVSCTVVIEGSVISQSSRQDAGGFSTEEGPFEVQVVPAAPACAAMALKHKAIKVRACARCHAAWGTWVCLPT